MQARPPRLPQRWCLPRSYRPWASKDSTYSRTSSLAPPSTRIAWKGERCTSATFPTVTRSTRKVLIWRLTSEHTRVRNLTSVRGKAARGSLPAQTNWHGITASTRDKSHLSAICVKDSFQEATICPCTWKDTRKITKWVNLDDNYGKHTFMLEQKPTQRTSRLCGARPVQVFAQYSPSLSFCNITAGFTLLFIALSQRNNANRRFIMWFVENIYYPVVGDLI